MELGVGRGDLCAPGRLGGKWSQDQTGRTQEAALSPKKVIILFSLYLQDGVVKGKRALGTLILTVKLHTCPGSLRNMFAKLSPPPIWQGPHRLALLP